MRKRKTPCTGDNTISKNNKPFNKTIYKSAIGSLIYLSKCTRLDIAFSVNKAARKSEKPTISDWNKITNIFRYMNSTKDYKIVYDGQGEIIAYTDADFGGDLNDRKSTSGRIILMGNSPIFWISKKQTCVATSTAEAKYISTSENIIKILWIRNILKKLINYNKTITIFTDNLTSKITIENSEINTKLKHIDIRFHFNRDNIVKRKINGTKMSIFANTIFKEKFLCRTHENVVKYLIDHRESINIENEYRRSPLYIECLKNNVVIVKYLIDHGADVNQSNAYCDTPLVIASDNANETIFKYLIEHCANVAYNNKCESIANYLIANGADVIINSNEEIFHNYDYTHGVTFLFILNLNYIDIKEDDNNTEKENASKYKT
ncbi:hypothetical protein U3516DRAFT_787411 [Neocallimastix sp. 'constans']